MGHCGGPDRIRTGDLLHVKRQNKEIYQFGAQNIDILLQKFQDFELVDLRRDKRTIYDHTYYVKKFLEQNKKPVQSINSEDIRNYLKSLTVGAPTQKNILSAFKIFFRDFLSMPDVIESFKFPRPPFKPKHIVSKEQLQRFYQNIASTKERALFLLYATSGLRREEIMCLNPENIDSKTKMITPNEHVGETKKSWVSFFNSEAEQVLGEYLSTKKASVSPRIFPMPRAEEHVLWKNAKEKTGLNVSPQRLREWFCCEMALLGVSDRYIDAFCGRTPKTILARNYTDYSPERLKQIYERANLKVLT